MDFQLACCGISTPNAKLPSAQRSLSPRTVSILLKLCVCVCIHKVLTLIWIWVWVLILAGTSFVISLVGYIKKPCGVQGSEALGPKCIQKYVLYNLLDYPLFFLSGS